MFFGMINNNLVLCFDTDTIAENTIYLRVEGISVTGISMLDIHLHIFLILTI